LGGLMIVDSRDSVNVLEKTVSRARLLEEFSSSIPRPKAASFVTRNDRGEARVAALAAHHFRPRG